MQAPAGRRFLALLLLLSIASTALSLSFASVELVRNGDFETGSFAGWTATNSKVLPSKPSEPSHSGKYSARIGTETREGRLFQTVEIPEKSAVDFTAWYRVEKHCSLAIFLKRTDGSVIGQWSAVNDTTVGGIALWTAVSHRLDASYAGQLITIEFVGIGYKETSPDYLTYWPYVDDVTFVSVDVYEAIVEITGLPDRLSTELFLDNLQITTIAGEESKDIWFSLGETHRLSVEKFVYEDNRTRYYCAYNSAEVDSDSRIRFYYVPQYYLSVSSPFRELIWNPSGWCNKGTEVSFSLDQNALAIPGPAGILGAKYVFLKWSGDISSSLTSAGVMMDGPKSVYAIWTADYSMFYLSIAAIVDVFIGGTAGAYYLFIARRRGPSKLPLIPPAEGSVQDVGKGVEIASRDRFEESPTRLLRAPVEGQLKEPAHVMDSERRITRMSEVTADSLRPGFEFIPDTSPSDKMRVLESIQGGMGRIVVVANTSGDRFAVKTFKYPEDLDDYKKSEKRFYREAALWVGLGKHPNIVRALSFGKMNDDPYLLLEFIDGQNLRKLITDRQLDLRKSLQIARDVCSGLIYAHTQGVVHGDIKPENILIEGSGRAKVTDFGLSRVPGDIGTFSVQIIGTLAYMPPEQLFSESEIDERSDIYSFGIVLYEMLTYKNPFRSGTVKEALSAHQRGEVPVPSTVQIGIPREIDRLVLRCVKRNPSERFRHFGELVAILEKYSD